MHKRRLISSTMVFTATLIVIPVVTLLVFFTGLKDHRALYSNALISVSILSGALLIFLTIGLFNGWKMKDRLGSVIHRLKDWKVPKSTPDNNGPEALYFGDGLEPLGCLATFIVWALAGVFGAFIFWMVGGLLWGMALSLAAVLYWIIFRAYRIIFKHSPACKGKILQSLGIATGYTILYTCWIFAIIFAAHYLHKSNLYCFSCAN